MISKDEIIQLLLAGKPISIVRYGDGESIMLNSGSSVAAFRLASEAVLRRQIGYDPTVKHVDEIRQNLIDCYSSADVIGISCHKQKVDGHWQKSLAVLKENVPDHTTNYCDIDLAYQMLEDDSYSRLLQNREVLSYISCRDLDEGFRRKFNIERVLKYTIAPEMKWTSGYNGDLHYPTQFNRIPRWMQVQSEIFPDSLLLVGAGVIGKIYCNWWRDRGGIAMDVGGVMDLWAGRVTRGPERGLDKIDLTYKL